MRENGRERIISDSKENSAFAIRPEVNKTENEHLGKSGNRWRLDVNTKIGNVESGVFIKDGDRMIRLMYLS